MQNISVLQMERPRNVNAYQAASLLYGDWGTSKAYVIGLAFALAGHSSFWLVLCVSILNIIVGLNYIIICKYYPNGGGVYASVRNRSEVLAFIGGVFLVCDYIVTASLSAFAAYSYFGVVNPEYYAIATIGLIGALNYFGPRHTGNLAFVITAFNVTVVLILGALSFFYMGDAVQALKPLHHSVKENWNDFVGIIVALSGVEAIANMTGVMKLDPGTSSSRPSVVKTSTPAIIAVMLEVSFFTALFALAVNALPGIVMENGDVAAPGYESVRDFMLKYMGEVFSTGLFGATIGTIFGYIISAVIGILLLSSVNTAIVALNSLLFIMSRDGQIPQMFQKINRFGVPKYTLWVSTLAPMTVLLFVNNLTALANLYAIGFVGAIATNLGSTSTSMKLDLSWKERAFMFTTCLFMVAVEITLFIDKPHARGFAISVIAVGLLLRALVIEQKMTHKMPKKKPEQSLFVSDIAKKAFEEPVTPVESTTEKKIVSVKAIQTHEIASDSVHIHEGPILCAVSQVGKSLEFALMESKNRNEQLHILFVREQRVLPQQGETQHWGDDERAREIFDYALELTKEPNFTFIYDVSDRPALNIVEHAKRIHASCVIIGMTRTFKILQMIRGDVITEVYNRLPVKIDLIIVS